jgi:protocatechuate 3,4-dioxygenase beta subunit
VLDDSGIVRRDIRSSFGSSTTTAEGVALDVTLTIVSASTGAALAGAAVYFWHCDREGRYSIYDSALSNENYLRGVQEADANGQLTFTTIYPGCYSGRWPHIHFEVYPSLASAVDDAAKIATSQLALTEESANDAYATSGYEQSVSNLSRISLESDGVFRDGVEQQTPATSGSASSGYTMTLTVPVNA